MKKEIKIVTVCLLDGKEMPVLYKQALESFTARHNTVVVTDNREYFLQQISDLVISNSIEVVETTEFADGVDMAQRHGSRVMLSNFIGFLFSKYYDNEHTLHVTLDMDIILFKPLDELIESLPNTLCMGSNRNVFHRNDGNMDYLMPVEFEYDGYFIVDKSEDKVASNKCVDVYLDYFTDKPHHFEYCSRLLRSKIDLHDLGVHSINWFVFDLIPESFFNGHTTVWQGEEKPLTKQQYTHQRHTLDMYTGKSFGLHIRDNASKNDNPEPSYVCNRINEYLDGKVTPQQMIDNIFWAIKMINTNGQKGN